MISPALALALPLLLAAEVELQPGRAHPGDVVLVTVRGLDQAPSGHLGPDQLTFLAAGSAWEALVAVKVEQPAGLLALEVSGKSEGHPVKLAGNLEVLKAAFRRRELTVSTRFTNPSKKDQQHAVEDQKAFVAAFDRDFEPLAFNGNFDWPRRAELTAPFGDLRLLNGKKQSQHFGLDLDGNTGDPIMAANDGVVVMVRECFGSGNTVLIAHGARLFTAYFHLSAFEVTQGARVSRGQEIGKVGKTGRVTGPHLHFGVKVDGRWANPESLLALDFHLARPAPGPVSDQPTSEPASPGTP